MVYTVGVWRTRRKESAFFSRWFDGGDYFRSGLMGVILSFSGLWPIVLKPEADRGRTMRIAYYVVGDDHFFVRKAHRAIYVDTNESRCQLSRSIRRRARPRHPLRRLPTPNETDKNPYVEKHAGSHWCLHV